jgi:hypothetical protein
VSALALFFLSLAWRADLRWCARHIAEQYWLYDEHRRAMAELWRLNMLVVGLVLLLVVRPLVGRWAGRHTALDALGAVLRNAIAVVLALVVSEFALRRTKIGEQVKPRLFAERLGEEDPRYGWRWIAPATHTLTVGGRSVSYAFNAEHNRARTVDDLPDFKRPTLIFAGESIAAGHGLYWEETYPALVGEALDLQVVNIGVHAFSEEQIFLRTVDELPRFEHPVAVVTLFIHYVLTRMEFDDHPHVVFDGLQVKAVPTNPLFASWRLKELWRDKIEYHDDSVLALAAKMYRETDRLAREHGARAIFVAPSLGFPTPRADAELLDELFTRQGLTLLDVDIGNTPLPNDVHPDRFAIRRLADAISEALRKEIARQPPEPMTPAPRLNKDVRSSTL